MPHRHPARVITGVPESNADLLHASRFFCTDPTAWFATGGRTYLLVNDLEVTRARREARVTTVLPLSRYERLLREAGVAAPHPFQALARALTERGVRRAEIPQTFPAGALRFLREAGIQVQVAPDPFLPGRSRKTPREIRMIRQVMRAAEAGMAAGILALAESRIGKGGQLYLNGSRLTSEILRDRIDATLFAAGAVPAHTIVAGGVQGADPHARGVGPLRAHHPIVLDLFPRSRTTGYYADITRTVVRGRAGERAGAAFRAVVRAREVALETIRAGVDGASVHARVCECFRKAGFPAGRRGGRREGFFHGTGHGLGLDLHEHPPVSRRGCRLEAGHVITVEPGLYYRDLGGIRIEDAVLVTRTGYRNLTRFPIFLEIP